MPAQAHLNLAHPRSESTVMIADPVAADAEPHSSSSSSSNEMSSSQLISQLESALTSAASRNPGAASAPRPAAQRFREVGNQATWSLSSCKPGKLSRKSSPNSNAYSTICYFRFRGGAAARRLCGNLLAVGRATPTSGQHPVQEKDHGQRRPGLHGLQTR